ncbi:methyl-accepting chemotaxis protein [Shewanella maritima]|uniref:Methyl-accepting chemotaxis protein n=1 Tax=Shewanella maritima TaxID=2520507 RepID=A0A411PF98_9GAMM|nr:methyl-accepting chemotaxis protein [Shewanella maritima]QBF82231.1 methyl-accepting chemotaxis protein [Shewanella maritima]
MKKLGFKASLLSAMTGLLMLSLLISSLVTYVQFKDSVQDALVQNIHHVIEQKVIEIKSRFERTTSAVTELAMLYRQENGQNQHSHVAMTQYTAKLGGVSKVIIGFDDGSSYVSKASESFPNGVGIVSKYDPRTRPWYQAGKRSRGISLSDVFFTRTDAIPMLGVMHQIDGGIIMADLRFDQLTSELNKLNEIEGATGFIVNKQGLVLASTSPFIEAKQNINDIADLKQVSQQALGVNQSVATHELNGEATLVASKRIELIDNQEWYVIVTVDESSAFAPLYQATFKLLLVVILVLTASVAGLLVVLNKLYLPIAELRTLVTELSQGNGDLTKRLEVKCNDDIGKIASGINQFISQLQSMMKEINQATVALSSGVHSLQQFSEHSQQILTSHTSETTQIVTAIEQLSNTAEMVEANTVEAAKHTHEAHHSGAHSLKTIESTQQGILALASQINETAGKVEHMNNETSSIQSIVDVIGAIAEQTNLLALNASIEAARAGEQGRGFAVVADEVRALASRTQTSTSEIEQALAQLKSEATNVVASIASTEQACGTTVEEVADTSASLQQMSVIMDEINALNSQNSTSASEQNQVIQAINLNMHQIHDMVETLNKEGQLQQQETANIAEINDKLSGLIGQFKL